MDEAALSQAIMGIVREAEAELDTKITSVLLNIPTYHTRYIKNQGSCVVSGNNSKIDESHVMKALNNATRFEKSDKEAVVSVVPVNYYTGRQVPRTHPLENGHKSKSGCLNYYDDQEITVCLCSLCGTGRSIGH